MKPRLGSSNEDGAMLLGSAGFNFDGSPSILAGGGRGSVFTGEDKAVVFNAAPKEAAPLTVQPTTYTYDSGDSAPSLGTPGGDSNDGNDGSSGVTW